LRLKTTATGSSPDAWLIQQRVWPAISQGSSCDRPALLHDIYAPSATVYMTLLQTNAAVSLFYESLKLVDEHVWIAAHRQTDQQWTWVDQTPLTGEVLN